MSRLSLTREVQCTMTNGTLTTFVMAPRGDIYQDYSDPNQLPVVFTPNFESMADKPYLEFSVMSSVIEDGLLPPQSVVCSFGQTVIDFGSDGVSTGVFAGVFKRTLATDENPKFKLEILKNIASIAAYVSPNIYFTGKAAVYGGLEASDVRGSYLIPVKRASGDAYRASIVAGDEHGFILTNDNSSCILKALMFQGQNQITSNLSYEWYKWNGATSSWDVIANQTSQTLIVTKADVVTYNDYRVKVSYGGRSAYDVQGVVDATDPYEIQPNPDPITEMTTKIKPVTYTPIVIKRSTQTKAFDTLFRFTIKDPAGVIVFPTDGSTPPLEASHTVTHDLALQCGGSALVTIDPDKESE